MVAKVQQLSPGARVRGAVGRRLSAGVRHPSIATASELRDDTAHAACVALRDPRQAQCDQDEQQTAHRIADRRISVAGFSAFEEPTIPRAYPYSFRLLLVICLRRVATRTNG